MVEFGALLLGLVFDVESLLLISLPLSAAAAGGLFITIVLSCSSVATASICWETVESGASLTGGSMVD